MSDFNVRQALANTFYQALVLAHEGGMTNGGGVAGIIRPQLDTFDASGTQLVHSDNPAVQPKPGDFARPNDMKLTDWKQEPSGKWDKPTYKAPQQDPALNAFLRDFADKLAAIPGISYMVPAYLEGKIDAAKVAKTQDAFAKENYPSDTAQESPELQAIRTDMRNEIAEKSRDIVGQNAKGYMNTALNMIQTPEIRSMLETALVDTAQNKEGGQSQFFLAPSSSSHNFHPADEINPGGLSLHSLRDVIMGGHICDIFGVKGRERDEILGALTGHDIEKGGDPWKGYAGNHGPLGETFLEHVWAVDPKSPDNVANPGRHMSVSVGRHMAQWNQSAPPPGKKYGKPDPLVPQNFSQWAVSMADYLGALDNVYVEATPSSGPLDNITIAPPTPQPA